MDDGKSDDTSAKKSDVLGNLQGSTKVAIEWLKHSPFAQQIASAVGQELGRKLGTLPPNGGEMDASRAQQLSTNLSQMMGNLIAECKEEQHKLRPGGVLGFGSREVTGQDVDTSVAGLTAITFHFLTEMLLHMRRARKMGSYIAQQMLGPEDSDTGPIPTPQGVVSAGLGGRGVLGAFALSTDRQRDIVNRLRGIHEYVIHFAEDIQQDIAGPHAASPSAHEKALNKAIMLSNRLDAGCTNILRLLDPTVDPQTIGSGDTGTYRAISKSNPRDR